MAETGNVASTMSDLFVAIGLIFVIEGLLYAIFPDGMKRLLVAMADVPSDRLRQGGIVAALIGFVVVWLIRR